MQEPPHSERDLCIRLISAIFLLRNRYDHRGLPNELPNGFPIRLGRAIGVRSHGCSVRRSGSDIRVSA